MHHPVHTEQDEEDHCGFREHGQHHECFVARRSDHRSCEDAEADHTVQIERDSGEGAKTARHCGDERDQHVLTPCPPAGEEDAQSTLRPEIEEIDDHHHHKDQDDDLT